MKISIVVVTWRARDFLASCLESLEAHAVGCQVIVVDNAPEDGTWMLVRRRFPRVVLLRPERNLGFAAGCNLGAEAATGDLVLFLNPDARALPGAVHLLGEALAADASAAAAGGHLLSPRGRRQARYAPRPLPALWDLARNVLVGQKETSLPAPSALPQPVGQVAGACLMVRRREFQRLRGFDATFQPVFFEDVDLCRRIHLAGRRILHVDRARFLHEGGACVRRMPAGAHYRAWFDNLVRYAGKHHGHGAALLLHFLTIPGALLRLGSTLLPGGGGAFGRWARAGACLRLALRNLSPWRPASQSTS